MTTSVDDEAANEAAKSSSSTCKSKNLMIWTCVIEFYVEFLRRMNLAVIALLLFMLTALGPIMRTVERRRNIESVLELSMVYSRWRGRDMVFRVHQVQ